MDLTSSSSLYSRPFYGLYFSSLWDKFMLCGSGQWSRPLLWTCPYLDLVLAHLMDFNNASSSWDESVHLMDLKLSTFCGHKVVLFKDLKTFPFHGLHELFSFFLGWSRLLCGLEAVHFKDLKTCPFHGLHELFHPF